MGALEVLKTLKELFDCTICCTSLANATQIKCGHIFCAPCVQTIQNPKNKSCCPLCKANILRRGLKIRYDLENLHMSIRRLDIILTSELKGESSGDKSSSSDSEDCQERPIQKLIRKRTLSFTKTPEIKVMSLSPSKPLDLRLHQRNSQNYATTPIYQHAFRLVKAIDLSVPKRPRSPPCIEDVENEPKRTKVDVVVEAEDLLVVVNPEMESDGEPELDVSFIPATPLKMMKPPSASLTPVQIVQNEPKLKSFRKFSFCPSRLTRTQLSKLDELCLLCDGTISKDYSDEVTHLIINLEKNRVPQTMKYLFAIADKKWVVVYDWVEECLKKGDVVNEEAFETSTFPDCDSGVKRSRTSISSLFIGINFYFGGAMKNSGASTEDCKKLVEKLGGIVVNSPNDVTENLIIIGEGLTTKISYQEWYKKNGWLTISWDWVLDCLLTYDVISFSRSHLITQLDGSGQTLACLPKSLININQCSPFAHLFRSPSDMTSS